MVRALLVLFAALATLCGRLPADDSSLPKYGPGAVRLYAAREYVRHHEAPDFWALMPYYVPQQTDSACSVACVAMVVNAARADRPLGASDELATHDGLLRRVASKAWAEAVREGGEGVTLDQLGELVSLGLRNYGVEDAETQVVHVADRTQSTRAALREALARNEESERDFLVVNVLQSALTGDPEGAVGHFAPIAAYNAQDRRVLILDPDRRWYEPYWVSEETLLDAMATTDPDSGASRGYLWVRIEGE